MAIKFEIKKRHLYITLILTLLLLAVIVLAYNTNNPAVFGHSAEEIEGVCKSDGTGCPTLSVCPDGASCKWEYHNIDEDSYGSFASTPLSIAQSGDTCDGKAYQQYTCDPSLTKECVDLWKPIYQAVQYREVKCKALRIYISS